MADLLEEISKLSLEDKPSSKTGLIFDERMKDHFCIWDTNHIERPERILFPLERCRSYGLLNRCEILRPRYANHDEVAELHDPEYIDTIQRSKDISDETELESFSSAYDAVYFNTKTYKSALLSVGCTLDLITAVLSGQVQNGMAIIRPPGHHAMVKEACGFCFFNNVALAAKHAVQKHGLKRILIVDWDVHHGQGTQQMFFGDSRVLYFSIHRYEHGSFWPNLRESEFDYIGDKEGKGFNINVPLNKTKLGNTEYLAIFHNVLLPIAFEFNPELVLISAGYDAALGCPEGEMEVTPSAYSHMINLLSPLAGGRMCVILEGGYCLPSLSESVALSLRTLLGDPCPRISPTDVIDESVVETILNSITVLRSHWKSIQMQNEYSSSAELNEGNSHVLKLKFLGNDTLCKPTSYPTRNTYPVQEPNVCLAFETKLEKLIGETNLTVPEHKTALVYDVKMNLHINEREKDHPECNQRLIFTFEKLKNSGVLNSCHILESRIATEDQLKLVHSQDYVNKMKSSVAMKRKDMVKLENEYESVYLCQNTFDAALISCGSLLQVVDSVLTGTCSNGFALVRPPGHHAEMSEACGFCIFNNIAIAASYAMTKYFTQKILILDWDVHHGNGTQHAFYDNNRVLFISLHRYDNGTFFPCNDEGNYDHCGKDDGAGFNINIPWNGSVGDGDYLAAFFHVVLPVAYEFCPDLVLVSSGFDAAQNDPLGDCQVRPECFGCMTRLLSGLANGKLILSLEGGYDLNQLPECALHCVRALCGEPCKPLTNSSFPSPNAIKTIQNVIKCHQKYWKCLQFGVDVPMYGHDIEPSDPDCVVDNSKITTPVMIPNREETFEIIVDQNSTPEALGIHHQSSLLACGGPDIQPDFGDLPEFYCVTPLEFCPHLELLQSVPPEGLNIQAPCQVCSDTQENWVCLHCYQVYCGRFVNKHMMIHGQNMQHYLALSFQDLSVWCYGCDSYVHNQVLLPVKQHVHFKKFGEYIG